MIHRLARLGLGLALPAVLLAAPVWADGRVPPEAMPGPLKDVRFDQHLGTALPLDTPFVDDFGQEVRLGDYFGTRPVVLAFVYYECPMLCSLILNGLAKSLSVLTFDVGDQFDVVVVSIDPAETPALAAAAKVETVNRYGRPQSAAGWHFLTGSADAITALTEAAGYRYAYDAETDEYAHTSGIVIATPDGTIAQYYFGIDFPPKDVRLAVVEASSRRIGTVVDQVLLYCFRYDPKLGKYTAFTMRLIRLAGAVFVVGLAFFLWLMWRRERAVHHRESPTLGAA